MTTAIFEENRVILNGNTYPIKDTIKSIGGRWDKADRVWYLPITSPLSVENIIPKLQAINIDTGNLIKTVREIKNNIPSKEFITNSYHLCLIHQAEAVVGSLINRFYLIGSEPGTGKTYMALMVADWLLKKNAIERVLVVCPSSIKQQWYDESLNWIEKKPIIIKGDKSEREILYKNLTNSEIIIINYELLQKDNIQWFTAKTLVVFDEASRFKNYRTKTYKIVRQLRNKATYCIALTGTPIENSLHEFWSIINILQPNLIGWYEFHARYVIEKELRLKNGRTFKKLLGYRNIQEFIRKISPFYIRHKKKDLKQNLPNKIDYARYIETDKLQNDTEKTILNLAYGKYLDAPDEYFDILDNLKKNGIFSVLTLLRLVADDPRLLKESQSEVVPVILNSIIIPDKYNNPKIAEIENILSEHKGYKIIIFTQFAKMAHLLNKAHPRSLVITGEYSNELKNEILEKYKKDNKTNILISTDTLAYGISLNEADVLINFDIPWSVGKLVQRSERIYRINSENTKYIYNLISTGVEKKVWEILSEKVKLFNQVVEGEAITDKGLRDLLIKKLRPQKEG